jgi:hypothetical protein
MSDAKNRLAAKGRVTALVIAGTAVFWIAGLFIGEKLGLSQRWLALIDLFALAGFVLAFAMIWQIWRARRDMEG